MSMRLRSLTARIATVATAAALALAGGVVATAGPAAAADPAWQTVFRDDFAGSGLPDPNKWILTLGTSYPGGPANFGTGEIETMTDRPENVDVRNGNLYITPQRDSCRAVDLGPGGDRGGEFQAAGRRHDARREPFADAECHRRRGDGVLAGVLDAGRPLPRRTAGRGRASVSSTSWRTSRA